MHIVFLSYLVPCPCLALKERVPVVGNFAVLLRRSPDVVVGVGLDFLTALLKPLVLSGGVINYKIHNDLHASFVGTVKHLFKCLHTAELLGNIKVV